MAISFVSAGTVGTGTNPVVAVPAGYASGDLLIIVSTGNAATSTPAGWTQLLAQGTQDFLSVFYKYASSSESSVTLSLNSTRAKAVMIAYRGSLGSVTVDATSTFVTASGATVSTTSLTTRTANEYVTSVYANTYNLNNSFWTAPGSTTTRVDSPAPSGLTVGGLLIVDELQSAAGASAIRSASVSTAINALAAVSFSLYESQGTVGSRLTSTGTLFVNGSFDEITTSTIRINSTTVYASFLDEVSLAAGSLTFSGTTSYLTSPNNSAFTCTGDFTIEAWVYPTSVTNTDLWALGTEAANRFVFIINNGQINTNLYGFGSTVYTSSIPANTWTHVAFVRSGSTIKLYVNGIASATTETQAGTLGNGVLYVGASGGGGSPYFAGQIANFRLVKSALYTTNFVPPQTISDSTAQTSLILNVLNSGDFIKDSGPNMFTLTNSNVSYSSTGAFNRGSSNIAQRRLSTGGLEVSGLFDEVTGIV